jgi:hypothetical protein
LWYLIIFSQELLIAPQLEMGDLRLHPDIEQILADEQWIGDATGLVPHCLAVLKSCHQLTERLAAIAMGPMHKSKLHRITEVVLNISKSCYYYLQSLSWDTMG